MPILDPPLQQTPDPVDSLCLGHPSLQNTGRRPNKKNFEGVVAKIGIVQKVFSEKASAIARMRQKCVRNASK